MMADLAFTIGAWAGAALVCLVVLGAAVFLVSHVMIVREERRNTREELNHRRCLMADSWWFSEDVPTMRAIQGLAGGKHVQDVREQWRRERAVKQEALGELIEAAGEMASVIASSRGVDGWHQNGDVASWDELGGDEFLDALAKVRGEEGA